MQSVVQMLVLTTAAGCAMFAAVAGHAGPCPDLSPARAQPMLCLKKYLPCATAADCPEGLTCGCSAVCGSVCRETGASFHALKRDGEDENAGSCPALPALSGWDRWSPFGCVNSCSSDTDCDEQHPEEEGRYKCCERVCGKRCVLPVHTF
ncbi:antileukoproteinase-like [Branchiostoma lanceolatum]|uniref:WAP four-disulfide core domain protein 5 n=1 Tax=Branchiostoma lanceolatum TaxID=7740 RepID=A0A8J9ZMQ9_BRALA|nr:Hypp1857 [Branchiostoma lanceolatum]